MVTAGPLKHLGKVPCSLQRLLTLQLLQQLLLCSAASGVQTCRGSGAAGNSQGNPQFCQAPYLHTRDGRTYYTVKQGDTLSGIAESFGSTVEIIRQANNLESTFIHPGWELFVPRKYFIQPGDTLSAIARTYGTSIQNILEINNIENADYIRAGDTMLIP